MNKKLVTILCTTSLLLSVTTKPISTPAMATGVMCGTMSAALIWVWNLELDEKNKTEISKTPVKANNKVAEFVQKHKNALFTLTRMITGGMIMGLVGYQLHPMISSVFDTSYKKKKHPITTAEEKAFEVFELPKTASKKEIKKKFKELVLRYHPDKRPKNLTEDGIKAFDEKIKQINEAKEILLPKGSDNTNAHTHSGRTQHQKDINDILNTFHTPKEDVVPNGFIPKHDDVD